MFDESESSVIFLGYVSHKVEDITVNHFDTLFLSLLTFLLPFLVPTNNFSILISDTFQNNFVAPLTCSHFLS